MEPIHDQTKSERVADRIVRYIAAQDLKSGDRLPTEREMSNRLGVGRTSVREALKLLQNMSVIEVRHGLGIFVNELSLSAMIQGNQAIAELLTLERKDLLDIYATRKLVEGETARLAATHRSPEHVMELETCLQQMEDSLDEIGEWSRSDFRFHVVIAEASRNGLLPKLLTIIQQIHSSKNLTAAIVTIPGAIGQSMAHHHHVFKAIRDQDPERAVKWMIRHIDFNEQIVVNASEKGSA